MSAPLHKLLRSADKFLVVQHKWKDPQASVTNFVYGETTFSSVWLLGFNPEGSSAPLAPTVGWGKGRSVRNCELR